MGCDYALLFTCQSHGGQYHVQSKVWALLFIQLFSKLESHDSRLYFRAPCQFRISPISSRFMPISSSRFIPIPSLTATFRQERSSPCHLVQLPVPLPTSTEVNLKKILHPFNIIFLYRMVWRELYCHYILVPAQQPCPASWIENR